MRPNRATGSQGVSQKSTQIIEDFKSFLEIDKQLAHLTVIGHLQQIRRFFHEVKVPINRARIEDIRNYLGQFVNENHNTYANVLKSLKVFFRDYMSRNDLVTSFKFPTRYPKIIDVPTKADLRKFYYALKNDRARAFFLIYASSGLRRQEVRRLNKADLDLEKRIILPHTRNSRTKRHLVSFYNDEAEQVLNIYLASRRDSSPRLLSISERNFRKIWKQAYEETEIKITPQVLRQWFANELGQLGVQDRYVDAFCGRIPKSVLAKHYTDYNPDKLKRIYDNAGLKVLS